MDGGGSKPRESEENLGTVITGDRQGGSRPEGVAGVLHRNDSGGLSIWVRDVGINVEDGEGLGKFPVQVCKEDHGQTAAAKEGKELDIPAVGGNHEGDENGEDMDLNSLEAEYGHAIHCNAADSGPMRTGHRAARRVGVSSVVVTDRDRPEGSVREGGSSSG